MFSFVIGHIKLFVILKNYQSVVKNIEEWRQRKRDRETETERERIIC